MISTSFLISIKENQLILIENLQSYNAVDIKLLFYFNMPIIIKYAKMYTFAARGREKSHMHNMTNPKSYNKV